MDDQYIFNRVKPYLNSDNQLLGNDYTRLFSNLNEHSKIELDKCLERLNINVIYDVIISPNGNLKYKTDSNKVIKNKKIDSNSVLKMIMPYVDNKNKLSMNDFNRLFSILNIKLQSDIIETIINSGIDIKFCDNSKRNSDNYLYNPVDLKVTKVDISHEKVIKPKNRFKQNTIQKINNLSNEQLCALYKNGEFNVIDFLIEKNEGLIRKRVIKYSKLYNHKLDEDDLYEYGVIGFIKAIQKFDSSFGCKLTTYAIFWIDQSILRSIADFGFTVRIPVHMFESIIKVNTIISKHPDYSLNQVYQELNEQFECDEAKFQLILNIRKNIMNLESINEIVGEDGTSELGEFLSDQMSPLVEEIVENNILKEELDKALKTLNPKEQKILRLRYGIDDDVDRTLEEVGKIFNLTRERIRQIEEKALKRLRHASRSKKYKDFYFL